MAGILGDSSFDTIFKDKLENYNITTETLEDVSSRRSFWGTVHWKIKTIEPPGTKFKEIKIKGQFPLEDGIKVKMENSIPETGSYGQMQPFIQWIKGELEIVTFDVVLYARDKEEDIDNKFNQFKQLLHKSPELRRPPICLFSYGSAYSKKCMVKGLGEVSIGRLAEYGQTRSIKFPITLVAYKPYTVKEIDKNKPKKESRYQIVAGEDRMYEMLANKEFGVENAIYGDRLRKRNKAMSFAADEEVLVKIPDADIILNEDVYPEFHAFDISRDTVAESFIDRFTARNNRIGYGYK